jgi:hypothetical protein
VQEKWQIGCSATFIGVWELLLRMPEPFWAVEIAEDDVIAMTMCTVIMICHFQKRLWPEPNRALACSRHGTRPKMMMMMASGFVTG